jgi:hypothetical protein
MALEDLITAANPYLPAGGSPTYESPIVIEQQLDVGGWSFKGIPHHIEKAIRIPYTYVDDHGVLIRDYLLIGYEGGGAY